MVLYEFRSCCGIGQFSGIGQFCIILLDLIQTLMVLCARNEKMDQCSTFMRLTVRFQHNAIRGSGQHLEITHQRIVANRLLTHFMTDDGGRRRDTSI
jgi:hypothetical protein